MHIHLCRAISLVSSLLAGKKKKNSTSEPVVEQAAMLSLLRQLQIARVVGSNSGRPEAAVAGVLSDRGLEAKKEKGSSSQFFSQVRESAYREFMKTISLEGTIVFTNHESLPRLEAAYAMFKEMFPRYMETEVIDELRNKEYGHLQETNRVCLDYCGFGLFSQLQQLQHWESSSFALADISVNLCSHALFGAAEEGTVELDIRKQIMQYLNIEDTEYSMVFTASRGATFKLLADAYPFETCRRLITMYDYESESVGWMVQRAKEKGAKVSSAYFRWPSLRICSTDLKAQLLARKRRKEPIKGLFVFPAQSRVSGAKYSYQWMSLAQQNNWHVLLDASALGPKDMGSLGLSLFRPDFIIASFYKVFGADPSGFGCLFIKNSAMQSIQDSLGAPSSGIVRIVPFPTEWLMSESSDAYSEESDQFQDLENDCVTGRLPRKLLTPVVSSFSGPFHGGLNAHCTSDEGKGSLGFIAGGADEIETTNNSTCEGNENISIGEVTRSPVFSEDGTDNLFCIDIGSTPIATVSCSSISEDPFSWPIRGPAYDGNVSTSVGTVMQSPVPVSRQAQTLLQESAGEGLASCQLQKRNPSDTEEGLNILEDGREELKVNAVPLDCMHNREQGVQLLAPGLSPLMVDDKSQYQEFHELQEARRCTQGGSGCQNVKENGPEHTAMETRQEDREGSQFGIVQSPAKVKEVVELSVMPIGRKCCKDLNATDTVDENNITHLNRHDEVMDNTAGENLCAISRTDKDAGCCIVYSQPHGGQMNGCSCLHLGRKDCGSINEMQRFPSSDRQKGKEKEIPVFCNERENAIRRETEGDFRLLGRRNAGRALVESRISCMKDSDEFTLAGNGPEEKRREPYYCRDGEGSSISSHHTNGTAASDDGIEEQLWIENEPEIFCKCLEHADTLGLNKINIRLRCLVNWLLRSLLQLHHPGPGKDFPLVHIYGPQVRFDRGASVAFNLYDCHCKILHPELVQMIADRSNISLGIGFLWNIQLSNNHRGLHALVDNKKESSIREGIAGVENGRRSSRIEVVTATLGLLSNFEDVYRLWEFVARFLDASFVPGEVGRHQSSG